MARRSQVLKEVWERIADEEDFAWVETVSTLPLEDSPCGDYGEIVRRMLKAGVTKEEIARFAKICGYKAVFGTLYVTGGGLHESILSADPTGREMRPPTIT